ACSRRGRAVSIAARPRPLPVDVAARLRRVVTALIWVGAAVAAGLLGILLTPILDRIIVGALLLVLVPVLVVSIVDFFRSPD
ncbi:hypothetical protein ACC848_40940, partial [Rhizobium johnstonii]